MYALKIVFRLHSSACAAFSEYGLVWLIAAKSVVTTMWFLVCLYINVLSGRLCSLIEVNKRIKTGPCLYILSDELDILKGIPELWARLYVVNLKSSYYSKLIPK